MLEILLYLLSAACMLTAIVTIRALSRSQQKNQVLTATIREQGRLLQLNTDELENVERVRQHFLSNMTHEIRNPLNGIVGIARLMRDNTTSGKEQPSELVTHLHRCANHLHRLLSQTLDYSSLQRGNHSLRPRPFNPKQIIEEVARIHKPQMARKALELRLDLPEGLGTWMGDCMLLRQILINIVSNAVSDTSNGYITIQLSYETVDGDIHARFCVSDTGNGIPEDQRSSVFEAFSRRPDDTNNETSSAGLELAIASEMAALMQGQLELDAMCESGAQFVLTLPFTLTTEEELPVTENVDESEELPLYGQHILIADDMDFNRYINKTIIQKMGAHVHEVNDGIAAQLALETMYFDFAILDINMPGLTGIEVVQKTLEHDSLLKPEFIALSAHATPEMKANCLAAGFSRFLEKPLDSKKLESLVARPVAPSPPARSTLDNSLLNYLAKDDPAAVTALENRYNDSLVSEIGQLKELIQRSDKDAQRQSIHKLKGIASFKKDTALQDMLSLMKQYVDVNAPDSKRNALCDQMHAHVNNL